MKKILLISLVCIFSVSVFYGANIEESKAINTGRIFMSNQISYFDTTIKSVELYKEDQTAYFYIINFTKGGWVLISSTDLIKPVIGYSATGRFSLNEKLPDNIAGWFHTYKQEIKESLSSVNVTATRNKEWNNVTLRSPASSGNKVAPIIKVKWNQGNPYNVFCPSDNNGRAVVGCVAVAMAQAMSVYSYPARPVGKYQYLSATYGWITVDYDKEAPYNWDAIMSGANNKEEVARLLYHCGVALKMNYGVDGSGTQSQYIVRALKDHFGFPQSVAYHTRATYPGDWKQLVINELQSGRPVCYNGADIKKGYGHCFNIDGYDGNNMFHVNWGWGGKNDGFFSLDGLKDVTMGMDYTAQQGVVVGIVPPSDAPLNIILSNNIVKEKQPRGTLVGDVSVQSYATSPVYEYKITGEFSSETNNYLPVPFEIVNSKLVTTEELYSKDGDRNILITATNTNNEMSLTQSFTITVSAGIPLTSAVNLIYDKTKREFVISAKEKISYTIYTGNDENIVASGELVPDSKITLDSKEWENNNIIQLSNASEKKVIKVILNNKKN